MVLLISAGGLGNNFSDLCVALDLLVPSFRVEVRIYYTKVYMFRTRRKPPEVPEIPRNSRKTIRFPGLK
jgi:hypothetical protein